VIVMLGDLPIDPETGRPVVSPENLEAATEQIRKRLVTNPELLAENRRRGQIKAPEDVIQDLEWSRWGAAQMVAILRDADRARRVFRAQMDRARARARMGSEAKSADMRDAEVIEATSAETDAYDAAEVAYEYARNTARMAESNQTAIQTIAKQVEITYRLAGTGRES
jgi:hypothetical protein